MDSQVPIEDLIHLVSFIDHCDEEGFSKTHTICPRCIEVCKETLKEVLGDSLPYMRCVLKVPKTLEEGYIDCVIYWTEYFGGTICKSRKDCELEAMRASDSGIQFRT